MISASKSKQAGTGKTNEEWETVQKFYKDNMEIKSDFGRRPDNTIRDDITLKVNYGAARPWETHRGIVKKQEKVLYIYGRSHAWESVRWQVLSAAQVRSHLEYSTQSWETEL